MNDLLAVHPNSCIPQVVCQFLNRTIAFASCQISFSTDPTYANLTNTDLANSTNIANVTVPLGTKLRPDTLYYYDVLAVGDSMPIRIKGNFTTGNVHHNLNTCSKHLYLRLYDGVKHQQDPSSVSLHRCEAKQAKRTYTLYGCYTYRWMVCFHCTASVIIAFLAVLSFILDT